MAAFLSTEAQRVNEIYLLETWRNASSSTAMRLT
jgi:hypothetical protein